MEWLSLSAVILDPSIWIYLMVGVGLGILFGSLPGFTATMGLAILTPLTFWVDAEYALAMLLGLLCAAIFSGGIPAILINTPGTPASISTTWDGYPLAQMGRAGEALGVNALGAFFGQFVSILVLAVAAFPMAAFALRFGPPEYFALAIFGISMMISLSSDSLLKGLLMGLMGLAIALVGLDPIVGYPRFTMGLPTLLDGISFIPVMVGLFGVAEVLIQLSKRSGTERPNRVTIDRVLPTFKSFKSMIIPGLVGSGIGTGVGIIPGAGGDIGSIIAWGQVRRISRRALEFGKGSLQGLAASCTAANAAIGGAMITMLTLGIPGDSVSAVLIGALLIHGLQPGPLLFRDHPEIVGTIVALLLMASFVTLLLGLSAARLLAGLLRVRDEILWGLILLVCFLGSYSLNQSIADVWVVLFSGIAGLVLRRQGYPMGPLVLGLILGPMAESNLRRSLVISQGDLSIFILRPISLILILLTLVSLTAPLFRRARTRTSTTGGIS